MAIFSIDSNQTQTYVTHNISKLSNLELSPLVMRANPGL